MKRLVNTFKEKILVPASAKNLAFFRIAVSSFALVQLLVLLPDWMWLYGPKGFLPWQISDAINTTKTPSLLFISNFIQTTPNATVYIITAFYFLSLISLLIGFKTKIAGVIAWLTHIIINTTGHFTAYGVETFLHIALFYCAMLPVGCCWSVDSYFKQKQIPKYLITLSVRIIQLHLCIMYFSCGIEKSMGSQWWNGEAIWMALQQDQFHQFNFGWMAQIQLIPKLLCWSTLIIETLYPFAIFWNKTKKLWLISIIGMHGFIAIFLGLQLFGTLMIILNITIFGKHCFPYLFSTKRIEKILYRKSSAFVAPVTLLPA